MRKRYAWLIISSAVILLFLITCAVLAFFGIEVFIFAVKFTEFAGLLTAVMIILLTVFGVMFLSSRKESLPLWLVRALQVSGILLAVLFTLAGLAVSSFLSEKTVNRIVSDDRRHEIIVQEDETFGGYNVTLYKRTGPVFKQEKKNFYIGDLAGEPDEISVVWYDSGCDVVYMRYPDYSDSPDPVEFTQRIFYSGNPSEPEGI